MVLGAYSLSLRQTALKLVCSDNEFNSLCFPLLRVLVASFWATSRCRADMEIYIGEIWGSNRP